MQEHDLLIYSFGGNDVQGAFRLPSRPLVRGAIDERQWEDQEWQKSLNHFPVWSALEPNVWGTLREDKQLRKKSLETLVGLGFPILWRTLKAWQTQRQALDAQPTRPAYLLLVATDRSDFLDLVNGPREPGQEEHPLRKPLVREPVWCHRLWAKHRSSFLAWLRENWHITIEGDGCLVLGKTSFHLRDRVSAQPSLLDFNRRATLFPMLEHLFQNRKEDEIRFHLGEEAVTKSLLSLIQQAHHLTFAASTGMPGLNQALQAMVRNRLAVSHPGRTIQILDQLETASLSDQQTVTLQAHDDVPYESILECRRTLWAFYHAWEFHAAQVYLKTLPAALATMASLNPHRQLMNWVEALLNSSLQPNGQHPELLNEANYPRAQIHHPVVCLQQRIYHSLHQHHFLDALIALLTLRDVVAKDSLNTMVPGLINEKGFIVGKTWHTIPHVSKSPGKLHEAIKTLEEAAKGKDWEPKIQWLHHFYDSFETIRKKRNRLVHRGELPTEDIQILKEWLSQNTAIGNLDQDLPRFSHWSEGAAKAGLAQCFPKIANLWPQLADHAIQGIDAIQFSGGDFEA